MNTIMQVLSTKYQDVLPEKINSGLCEDFAWLVYDYDNSFSVEYDDDNGHVYLCKNGLYFDAECPNGVEEVDNLPYYKRIKRIF